MQGNLVDLWAHMGAFARVVIGVLLLMSLSSLLIAAERALFFLKDRAASRAFAERVGALLDDGDFAGAARAKTEVEVGHIGRVIGAGLKAYSTTREHEDDDAIESVARALERQSQREVQRLRRGQGWLGTVGATAPFVGLLGTVVGIVNAFDAIAAAGSGGIGTVSAGIAEALVTTAFGLLVAIPAVVAFNFVQSWVDARSVDLAESSNELLDKVALSLKRSRRAADARVEADDDAADEDDEEQADDAED
jgi:biopolymer transport protein TolQ